MEDKMTNKSESNVDSCENGEIENCDDYLAPLRALETALSKRISVSTSRIKLCQNDASTTEFVCIEGKTNEKILGCLEESVSDIMSSREQVTNITSGSFNDALVSSSRESTIINDSTKKPSVFSTKTSSSFYSIPSCTSSFDGIVDAEELKNAEKAIADLEGNGPAGLVHLSSLSDAIGKPIRVWKSGNDNESRKVGRTRNGEPVNVEYHEPGPSESHGHWTLPGNREARDVDGKLNDCLFSVVADQTERLAPELRSETIERMRKNIGSLANRIKVIAEHEKCDRISLLVGGARYNGERPQDARIVIDKSQEGRFHPDGRYGHPRGHASHPGATGPTESAENYSRTGTKSAFMSREDQDAVGHLALETGPAQNAMRDLNNGQTSIAVRLNIRDLSPGALPEGLEFSDGVSRGGPKRIRELLLVLRHHLGQQNNPEADVFVHTFYPILQ